jgi:hypothetical protein
MIAKAFPLLQHSASAINPFKHGSRMARETIACGEWTVSEISISPGLRDGGEIDILQACSTTAHAQSCRLCGLTPLGHGLLPIAGALLAFLALVFGCR